MRLASLWGFVAGLSTMASAWIYSAHESLTCPQKSMIILLGILAALSLAIALTIARARTSVSTGTGYPTLYYNAIT